MLWHEYFEPTFAITFCSKCLQSCHVLHMRVYLEIQYHSPDYSMYMYIMY